VSLNPTAKYTSRIKATSNVTTGPNTEKPPRPKSSRLSPSPEKNCFSVAQSGLACCSGYKTTFLHHLSILLTYHLADCQPRLPSPPPASAPPPRGCWLQTRRLGPPLLLSPLLTVPTRYRKEPPSSPPFLHTTGPRASWVGNQQPRGGWGGGRGGGGGERAAVGRQSARWCVGRMER